MKLNRFAANLTAGLLMLATNAMAANSGLATRDLNPMLQAIYLPSRILSTAEDGWRVNHSVFITNTSQRQTSSDESLLIDVENYRYVFDLGYRQDSWVAQISIPLLANRGGELDGLIEDWHDFFGFSNGARDNLARDQIQIEYQRDGIVEYSQTRSSSDIGDIAIAVGFQAPEQIGYFAGIELPSGSVAEFSGNESVDFALWIARDTQLNPRVALFGMLGLSFPGNDGNLGQLLADQIWLAQLGFDYRFDNAWIATAQLDLHSAAVDDSSLRAFNQSIQIQLGLGIPNAISGHRLDLFFAEDIRTGSAPDISFGLSLSHEF